MAALGVAVFSSVALAHHHQLNGTWQLVPSRSQFNGEVPVQSGTVTINDREGNISVERNFNLEDGNKSVTTNFATDSRHGSSIKQPGFKSKAKWDGDVLKVTTDHEGVTTMERYQLTSDGGMELHVERTGHPTETLYFTHQ
ncbi:MAG TPA: hypothetical protein VFW44_02280 [Bryobacteraceae bacterium]|nr:hypothetical protein [Bryobacteraceae bacterium]